MKLLTRSRFGGRIARMGALLVAAATFGLVVPAAAQIQTVDRYAVTDFAVKVPNADVDLGAEARDKVRDALTQVFGRNRETVPTDQVSRAMRELGLMPPVTRSADLLRLGDSVDAQYVVTGEVANWRIQPVAGGRQAQVQTIIQIRNVSGGVAVNAAVATGKSAPRADDTSDATLLSDALNDAAFQLVSSMEANILPKATVLNTTNDRVLLNQGARSGVKSGMRMIILRGTEQVAEAVVTSTDPDSAWARITRQTKGVSPGDVVQTVVEVPVLRPGWSGSGEPRTATSRSSSGNSGLVSLLLLLVILGFLFLGGRGGSNAVVGNVRAEAQSTGVSTGVRVSWTLDAFARGNNEGPFRWQVWRQGVNTNPVAVALAPASSVVDDTLGTFAPADGSQWDDFGGVSGGNSCTNSAPPGGDDPVSAGPVVGVPQRYSVEMVYRVDPNSLPFPPNTTGGGTGTTGGGTTGTTGGTTGTTGTTGGTTGTTGTTGGTTGTTGTTGGGGTGGGGTQQYCYFVSIRVPAIGQATPLAQPSLTGPSSPSNDTGTTVFTFNSARGVDLTVPLEYVVQLSPDALFGSQSVTLGEFVDTSTASGQVLATQPISTGTLFPTSTRIFWRIGVRNLQDVPGPVADATGKRYVWSGARQLTR